MSCELFCSSTVSKCCGCILVESKKGVFVDLDCIRNTHYEQTFSLFFSKENSFEKEYPKLETK